MKRFFCRLFITIILANVSSVLYAQTFTADRLKRAAEVMGLQVGEESIMPDTTISLKSKDGRMVTFRTNPMGEIEHIGIPLFMDIMRYLQPSPVYDFLEYAVMNWKYKVNPNQLYLSKVIFKKGNWDSLLSNRLYECECSIENREDKLYIVKWQRAGKDVAVIGIPIEYELLNNDTRRNMEWDFIRHLKESTPINRRSVPAIVNEEDLCLYGLEDLFVLPGKSYIVSLLNQNIYYKLTTVYEAVDTVINNKLVTINAEAILPVIVNDIEFPAESLANLINCDDSSLPDVNMELDFHLSNYHREIVSMPLSQFKAYCRQQGCALYFACDGVKGDVIRGVLFASNLPKGYNHLLSLRIEKSQLCSSSPTVKADVYLYIPPIDKEKLFGIAPTKKSNVKLKLP